jgi:uncharacterized protein (TIGR03437 family)
LLITKRPFIFLSFAFLGCCTALNAQTVRFATTLGGIDVILTPSITPMTVANFMTYVTSGEYNNTIIHRSLSPLDANPTPPYVIQGGGYALGPANLPALIPQNPPVTNEFKTSNTAGTLAMALSGSDIDSATDQWYFNVEDNSSTLDSQDFTVFGNIANDASQAVAVAINSLPTYSVDFGQEANFGNLPLQNYVSGLIKPANYIFVTSIAAITPTDSAAGVANAATALDNINTGISPGEMLTIYGSNLGPTTVTTLTLDPTNTYVTNTLEGTQVLFTTSAGTYAGPMIFTADGQIAVMVPYEIAGASSVTVVVSYLGIQTNPVTFNVVAANPGIFTLNYSGVGDAAIIRFSDSSVISKTNPASVGDVLEVYGEGYGLASASTALPDGTLVVSSLPVPAAKATLLIDGNAVPASYIGGAGYEINGMMQVNFTVPQLTPGTHQIQVRIGSAISPAGVTLETQ